MRTDRSGAIVHAIGAKFKSVGQTVFYESASRAGQKWPDFFRLLSGRHFDVGVYSLDENARLPLLRLGAGAAGGPSVQTAAQQTTWRKWVAEADKICFGALTLAAAKTVKAHSPVAVIPITFSAGGALRACDNELLSEPGGRKCKYKYKYKIYL